MIFAPCDDDPVLISQVTIANHHSSEVKLRWVEYWGCQPHQFSHRSFIESFSGKNTSEMRRDFGERFAHHFRIIENNSGLFETKEFLGRSPAEEAQWQAMLEYLRTNPHPFVTVPADDAPTQAAFDDLDPPPTFLVSLDAPAEGLSTNGKEFFGAGGVSHPTGLDRELDGDLSTNGPASALLLERSFTLAPGARAERLFFFTATCPKEPTHTR